MTTHKWIESEVPRGLEVRQVYGFIFSHDGRILLLEDDGHYNLPGGKPEKGESFAQTLIREANEEVQVTIDSIEYLGYQLVQTDEEFAQVRLVALLNEMRQAAPDPCTGRQYRRLLVPPTTANEFLKWGKSGNDQITRAMAAVSKMDTRLTIRAAGVTDAPGIARVNYSTWLQTFPGLIPDSELESLNLNSLMGHWAELLSIAHPKTATLVALDGESVIAYSRFYPSVDADESQTYVATIGSLYVEPQHQRRGIGRKLTQAVLEAAKERDFTAVTLHVLIANQRARHFYEKLGWVKDMEADIAESNKKKGLKVRYRKSLL